MKAPADFATTLAPLPEGVTLRHDARGRWDLLLWFVRTATELKRGIAKRARSAHGPMWIAWPKKRAGSTSDLTQQLVRTTGLAAGLVDYKICRIDEIWSALLFRKREENPGT